MIPSSVQDWLAANDYGAAISVQSVGGGCINNGSILKTTSGVSFFLKHNPLAPVDMFLRELEGLEILRSANGPTVPEPYCCGKDFLLMADLAPTNRVRDYWQSFGRQLATLHNHTDDQFGFLHDNYIGSTPQPNPRMDNGYAFFAEQRLIYIAQTACDQGQLDRGERLAVEDLANRLPEIVPKQPASLIHGDLWSGNAMTDSQGAPAIIDPAAHYGWAEADLAMTSLFGSFPDEFYQSYTEVRPLPPGFRSRFPIYNLYHLLNHVLLFGRGYLGQVKAILRKYRVSR
jgi:protein-ribulosamine 3-kinase